MKVYFRLFILAAVVQIAVVSSIAAVCHDHDGDTYGTGCPNGPDCNDDAPAINPGATEVCDGVDNDCDTVVDEGFGFQTCGLGICKHVVLACAGGSPVCDPFRGAVGESCNGVDDNCDGIVDNLTGTDLDGDGASPPCDCDDTDPLVNKLAVDVCHDGRDQDCDGRADNTKFDGAQQWCVSIEPMGDLVVDQPSTFLVKAFHPAGVHHVHVADEFPGFQIADCATNPPASYCERTVEFVRTRRGVATMASTLYKSDDAYGTLVGAANQTFPFDCVGAYCKPDPLFSDFADWMRLQSVPECVIGDMFKHTQVPFEEELLRPLVRLRPKPITTPQTIQIVDVVASDEGALNRPLTSGTCRIFESPPLCQADPDWPAFCPSPVPADTTFLLTNLRKTFGIDLSVQYTRRCTNYAAEIGLPDCANGVCSYPSRANFLASLNLPGRSLVHYAIQSLNNGADAVNDMTGETSVGPNGIAEVGFEPDTSGGVRTASHELGHTFGLLHSFYGPSPVINYALTSDGIMANTYFVDVLSSGDPLSPLERYILEPTPPATFSDAATWPQDYKTIFVNSGQACGPVDPAIALPNGYYSYTYNLHSFDLRLLNKGTGRIGFASLRAYDNNLSGRLIDEQFVNLDRGDDRIYRFTFPAWTPIGQINVTQGKVWFVLDLPDAISAAAGDVAANNAITAYLAACADADGDGYTMDCVNCYNANCPVRDCDDNAVNGNRSTPGGIEGPVGAANCFDGFDNNCLNGYDNFDPLCRNSVDVVKAASDETTQGSRTGTFQDTWTSNLVYETLTEGGQGTRLVHIWTFNNVQAGTSNDLIVMAHRPATSESENFKFSYLDGSTYRDIPSAIISNASPEAAERVYRFPNPVSGTVKVRITDVTTGGSTPDSAKIDYIVIRTNH